jgi:hypothetical protein
MVLFIVALVVVIVNYTIYPIFDFGSTPNALIHIPQSDWTYSWADSDPAVMFVDSAAAKTLPTKNFSLYFDTKVIATIPTADTNMRYVLVYKTTAGSGTAAIARHSLWPDALPQSRRRKYHFHWCPCAGPEREGVCAQYP